MVESLVVAQEKKRVSVFMSEKLDIMNKRPRFEDEDHASVGETRSSDPVIYRANEIIQLVFVDTLKQSRGVVLTTSHPEYTHQLYEQEQVDFLKCQDVNILPSVNIFVRCSDLAHHISTRNFTSPEEKASFLELMKRGAPSDSTFKDIDNEEDESLLAATLFDSDSQQQLSHQPIGTLLNEFRIGGEEYELRLASHKSDPDSTRLLRRGEKLAMWFIETADSVDFEDERWEIIILYQKQADSSGAQHRRLFGGYITLFTFHNPFAGSKLRVCQALVLPHLQGRGTGREMLLAVYRIAAERSGVSEITVEDPCPAFERLRDAVDAEWFMDYLSRNAAAVAAASNGDDAEKLKAVVLAAKSADTAELKEKLKLTSPQANFSLECLQYAALVFVAANTVRAAVGSSSEDEEVDVEQHSPEEYRVFRLAVKRRILKDNMHLKTQSKDVMQKELDALFGDILVRYKNAFKSIQRQLQRRKLA